MEGAPSVFSLGIDLPVNKVPVAESRLDLKERLKELNLAPAKNVVMVTTTIERSDNIARNVGLQIVDGGTKPLLVFEARKVFKDAPQGHYITIRKDFSAFSFEPNVNYSLWSRASSFQARWWKEWHGTMK